MCACVLLFVCFLSSSKSRDFRKSIGLNIIELLGKWYHQTRARGRKYSVNNLFPENRKWMRIGTFRLERPSSTATELKYNMEVG